MFMRRSKFDAETAQKILSHPQGLLQHTLRKLDDVFPTIQKGQKQHTNKLFVAC